MRKIEVMAENKQELVLIHVLDETDKEAILGIMQAQNEIEQEQYERIKKLEAALALAVEMVEALEKRVEYLEFGNRRLVG